MSLLKQGRAVIDEFRDKVAVVTGAAHGST
jgi:hypothetical protein